MRTRLGGWLVVVGVLVGAGMAGHHLSDRPMPAAQSGTSTSGSVGEGGGGVGTGTDGTADDGGDGGGGGGAPAPTPTAPATTAPAPTRPAPPATTAPTPPATSPRGEGGGGGGGAGSGSASRQEDEGPDDGTSGFSPRDDGGSEHDDEPYALRPAEPAPERRRIAPGRKTGCPAGTRPEVRCFSIDDWDDADAVEVPDGAGGTVVVPLAADLDRHFDGTSFSGGSNVDLRIHIDLEDGTIEDVERRADDTTQAVLLTLAVMLLVLVLVGLGGTLLRLQGLGG